jgi:hypothetical protein
LRAADRGQTTVLGRDPLRDHAEITRRVGVQLQHGQLVAAGNTNREAAVAEAYKQGVAVRVIVVRLLAMALPSWRITE